MEENFEPVAQSRANYYTPGSPVQFVRVELLRGDQSGDNAVCLTFKNIGQNTITGLDVQFRCKGGDGSVLCEEAFQYTDLDVKNGELFGMDDAVFITGDAIGSVDVQLQQVYSGTRRMDLREKKRVRLPAPKRLPAEMAGRLEQKTGRRGLKFMPQVLENGWYCACGAFHPAEEDTVYCSECGSDRILLQNALSGLMQPEQQAPAPAVDEPTRVAGAQSTAAAAAADSAEHTRTFAPDPLAQAPAPERRPEAAQRRTSSAAAEHFVNNYRADVERAQAEQDIDDDYRDDEDYEEELDPRDERAEAIIRWVPALTAVICAAIALGGFLYCRVLL